MGHYNFLYEGFLESDADEQIEDSLRLLNRWKTEREEIRLDLKLITTDTARTVLERYVGNLSIEINNKSRELERWQEIKKDISEGKKYNYSSAHNYAKRG